MSTRLILLALLVASPAYADGVVDEVGEQALGIETGLALGGRDTPGGLRIAAHYDYQLSDTDWFDGTASFTFGGGTAACFRDRDGSFVCDHGLAQGDGAEVIASVRRVFTPQGKFRPFARAGIGLGFVHYASDGVSGATFPLHAGGGVRAQVADSVAVVAQAELTAGLGVFNRGLSGEPQFGAAIVAGAEFRLK